MRVLIRHPGQPPRDVDLGPGSAVEGRRRHSALAIGHMEGGFVAITPSEAQQRWLERRRWRGTT